MKKKEKVEEIDKAAEFLNINSVYVQSYYMCESHIVAFLF